VNEASPLVAYRQVAAKAVFLPVESIYPLAGRWGDSRPEKTHQ
jgi:hypothetical protein